MADAETLKEFLVGVRVTLDESSLQRAQKGMVAVGQGTSQLQTAINGVQKALTDLGKSLNALGGEPAQHLKESNRQIGLSMEGLKKGVLEWGKLTSATVAAFVTGMRQVAKQYTDLYFITQRTGESARDLAAMAGGFRQIGQGADEGASAVTHLLDMFKTAPGTEGEFLGKAGKFLGQIKADFRDADQGTQDYIAGLDALAEMPEYLQKQFGEKWFGWSYAETRKQVQNKDLIIQGLKDEAKFLDEIGETREKSQTRERNALKLTTDFSNAWAHFQRIFTQAFDTVFPDLDKFVTKIDDAIKWIDKFNAKHPGAAALESFGLLAAGVASVEAAIHALTGSFFLLNPWVAALAGAAALIVYNWDKLGPYFEKKVKEIEDEFKKGDWIGIAKTIASIFSDAFWTAIRAAVDFSHWLTTAVDWEKAGERIGKFIVDAITALFESAGTGEQTQNALIKAFGDIGKAGVQIGAALIKGIIIGIYENIPGLKKALNLPGEAHEALVGPERAKREREAQEYQRKVIAGEAVPQTAEDLAKMPWLYRMFHGAPAAPGGAEAGARPSHQQGGIVTIDAHEGEMVLPRNISEGLQRLFRYGGGDRSTAPSAESQKPDLIKMATTIAGEIATRLLPGASQVTLFLKMAAAFEKAQERAERDPRGVANPERGQETWNRYFGGTRFEDRTRPGQSWLAGQLGMAGAGQDQGEARQTSRKLNDWLTGLTAGAKVVIDNVDDLARELAQQMKLAEKGAGAAGGATGGGGGTAAGEAPAAPGEPTSATVAGPPAPPTTTGGRIGGAIGRAVGGAVGAVRAAIGGPAGAPKEATGGLRDPLAEIIQGESGGRNAPTGAEPGSTAAGYFQFLGKTWREQAQAFDKKYGTDISIKYPTADVAPKNIQYAMAAEHYNQKGFQPWQTDPRETLSRRIAAAGGEKAYPKFIDPRQYLQQPEPMTAGPVSPGFPGAAPQAGEVPKAGGGAIPYPVAGQTGVPSGKVTSAHVPPGVDPDLHAAVAAGMEAALPPGYTAKVTSGQEGRTDPRSQHFLGHAEDWQIFDEKGNKIPNRGAANSALYRQAYIYAMGNMMVANPEKAKQMGWGGHFGTEIGGGGVEDTMHYDLGGARGRLGGGEKAITQEHQEAALYAQQLTAQRLAGQPAAPSAQFGALIPQVLGGVMPLLAHAGEMVLPRNLSMGLQRIIGMIERPGGMMGGMGGGFPGGGMMGGMGGGLERMLGGGGFLGSLERIMGGGMRLGGGMTANYGGNRTINFNQTNNHQFGALGADSANTALARFRNAHERLTGDMVRNFRAALA